MRSFVLMQLELARGEPETKILRPLPREEEPANHPVRLANSAINTLVANPDHNVYTHGVNIE